MAAVLTTSQKGGSGAADAWQWFGEMMHSNILEEFYPRLLLHDYGQHISLPGNSGKTIHVRRWDKADPVTELEMYDATGNLAPGIGAIGTYEHDPAEAPSAEMTLSDYPGTIQSFGGYFAFTDVHMNVSEVMDTLSVGARQLGGSYAKAVELNAQKKLLATMAAGSEQPILLIAGSGGGTAAPTWAAGAVNSSYTTVSDIFQVVTEFTSNVEGEAYTYPDGTYKGILHPRVKHDLFTYVSSSQPNLVDWIQTSRGQGMYESGKIPVIGGVAIEISAFNTTDPYDSNTTFDSASATFAATAGNPFGAGETGYLNLFFAPGAYSNIDLANATPSLIIQPFGSGGATGDPLKTRMTIGIKGYQTCIPHNVDRRMVVMATQVAN